MLTKIYIEALLIDEDLADQVWEAWDAGMVDDETTCIARTQIAILHQSKVYTENIGQCALERVT
jgi:hypothetical protein